MLEFVLVLAMFLMLVAAMSIGVLLGRKPIAGSCGGMAALGMQLSCDICGGDTRKCEESRGDAPSSAEQPRAVADAVQIGR